MIPASDALRFACQPGCTKCCQVKGYVYLTEEDLCRAARFVGLSRTEFEKRYVIRFKRRLRLRKPKLKQCHFLTEQGCSIHPVKPVQCRLYPMWPELVESRANWRREGRLCPGIGQGPLIQIGTACETAAEMKRAYPALYSKK